MHRRQKKYAFKKLDKGGEEGHQLLSPCESGVRFSSCVKAELETLVPGLRESRLEPARSRFCFQSSFESTFDCIFWNFADSAGSQRRSQNLIKFREILATFCDIVSAQNLLF
jgi:hypothetical protein